MLVEAEDVPVDVLGGDPQTQQMWSVCDFHVGRQVSRNRKRVIYEAKELRSEKECIIKAYSKSAVLVDHAERQVERELNIHSALLHPNIVKLYCWFFDSRSIYMVLEPCDLSLSRLLESKYSQGAPLSISLNVMYQVASAVSFIHSLKVLHRDIKPSNIYLQSMGTRYIAKLGDFGTAVHTKPDDLRLSIQGTAPYLAPEIVDGLGHSFPADIWSFGITFHETISCQLPFDGPSPGSVYKAIHHSQYSLPTTLTDLPDSPDRLLAISILSKCMQKDPKNRPAARELVQTFSSSNSFLSNYPRLYSC